MIGHVIIVGGGVIGSSIAAHIAAETGDGTRVSVVERDPSYARASSSLSASSIRQQFSTPVNIALSQYGIAYLREAEASLAVAGDRPALGLREPGYLFLASEAGLAVLHANHLVQRAAGAAVVLLDPAELRKRFPWLDTDGVAAGSLGLEGEGWFDGPALLQAFRRKARALGVQYLSAEAVDFELDTRLRAVLLRDGTRLATDRAVIAAGGWSSGLAARLGLEVAIRPRRRLVFVVACRQKLERCPLLIDPSGVWMRPEGDRFLCGLSPAPGEADPDEPPLEVDESRFLDRIWPVLAARIPAFAELKLTGSWAGYYDMHLFDYNGLVGAIPGCPDVLIAAGFSGHGMQHAPGVGRAVAELIVDGEYRTLDLTPLAPERVALERRLLELNVV